MVRGQAAMGRRGADSVDMAQRRQVTGRADDVGGVGIGAEPGLMNQRRRTHALHQLGDLGHRVVAVGRRAADVAVA